MPGVESYGLGYRGYLTIRTCTFPTAQEAAKARAELLEVTKRLRTRQRIKKLERTISPSLC